ncbi:MAG: hypothetical protein KDD64_07555 [Bdellovibrionales bacterium]|nr:hypothetical protein [Bdellovibrionales bacterium]
MYILLVSAFLSLPSFAVMSDLLSQAVLVTVEGSGEEIAPASLSEFGRRRKRKKPKCRDGKDNDHDGLVDYPDDPGCRSRRDRSEKDSSEDVGGTVGADLNGRRLFPSDNPWNQDISAMPVDLNSDELISSIGRNTGLHPDFGTFWQGAPNGIPYVAVRGDQKKSTVDFYYQDESDAGPYPIPNNAPIEGGENGTGDRHILILDSDNWTLYELYDARKSAGRWTAGSGAIFDLNSNELRPEGWTSADAAGLPILPGLVRYDEVVTRAEIKHALRFTASVTRKAYVAPARHHAGSRTDEDLPPMGMRVRLKSDFDISGYSQNVQVILRALKTYGMFLADNGSDWFISGAPDSRWSDDELSELSSVKGRDFEVIQMGEIVED